MNIKTIYARTLLACIPIPELFLSSMNYASFFCANALNTIKLNIPVTMKSRTDNAPPIP